MSTRILLAAVSAASALGLAACGGGDDGGGNGGDGGLSGTVRVDGSSTVAPLTERVAERFQEENPDVRVTVGTSGTGGGFEKFCAGETDISDASRQIEASEERLCERNDIRQAEVQVANDALTVVVNPENPVTCMTVDQLNQVWDRGSDVNSWSQIRDLDAEYDEDLELFGPGTDSGTFDYFTEAINGEEGVQRTDYNNVGEDDNATVTGVAGSPGGLGYFGFSFFEENQQTLKALEIESPDSGECVAPSEQSVQDGTYKPLGRPLFIYPSDTALEKPEVKAFVDFYVENANSVAPEAGFIAMTEQQLTDSRDAVERLGDGKAR